MPSCNLLLSSVIGTHAGASPAATLHSFLRRNLLALLVYLAASPHPHRTRRTRRAGSLVNSCRLPSPYPPTLTLLSDSDGTSFLGVQEAMAYVRFRLRTDVPTLTGHTGYIRYQKSESSPISGKVKMNNIF